jgi:hypothetical protein
MHDNKIKELLQAQKEKKKVIGYKQNLLLTNFPYLYHMSLKLLLMEKKMKSHTSLSLSLSLLLFQQQLMETSVVIPCSRIRSLQGENNKSPPKYYGNQIADISLVNLRRRYS